MEWARILAYITGTVDQASPQRIPCCRKSLSDGKVERPCALLGRRTGDARQDWLSTGPQEHSVKWRRPPPDTILARYRPLVARKFDGSPARRVTDRPRIDRDVQQLIIRMARENRSWGYDRIVGPLPILDTISPIRRSATCCAVTVYRRRRNANVRSPGRNSFGLALLAANDFFIVEVLIIWRSRPASQTRVMHRARAELNAQSDSNEHSTNIGYKPQARHSGSHFAETPLARFIS
jgi:putative transposase